MISDITGIILAGGKSSRMGEDKAFLDVSGKSLIENTIDSLLPIFGKLLIITNTPAPYQKYGIETRTDIIKAGGPLGGICTGLIFSDDKYNFVTACDMPFLNQDLIRYMIGQSEGYDAVIAKHEGRLQPLCAVYSKNCIEPMKNELLKNNLKVRDFLKFINPVRSHSCKRDIPFCGITSNGVKVRVLNGEQVSRFDADALSFVNINTPEEYEKFRNIKRNGLDKCYTQAAAE